MFTTGFRNGEYCQKEDLYLSVMVDFGLTDALEGNTIKNLEVKTFKFENQGKFNLFCFLGNM